MATDPNREPSLADVYHLVSLLHEELKLVKRELKLVHDEIESLQRQFTLEMGTISKRFDAIERDIATLFRHVVGGEES